MKLFRYELFCEDERQDVGFLVGLDELLLSVEKESVLLEPFNENLPHPAIPGIRNSASFFTEKGNHVFCEAIQKLIDAYKDSMFDVKSIELDLPASYYPEIIYEDDYQIILPGYVLDHFLEKGLKFESINKNSESIIFQTMDMNQIGDLFHVGTMDITKKRNFSFEGNGLSVSNCPDEWCFITEGHTSGDYFHLSKESMKLLDFYSMIEKEKQIIYDFGVENGLVVSGTLYKAFLFGEDGEEYFSLHETYEEALEEAGDDPDYVELIEGYLPTEKLKTDSYVQVELINILDLLTEMYADKVLGYDGIYWEEELDVSQYSAPRGVIFNSRLDSFQIKKLKSETLSLEDRILNAESLSSISKEKAVKSKNTALEHTII